MYDVTVLGAGPAGLTAAMYTARAKLKTILVTGPTIGGQIALTYQVDNYPGFPQGITGPDLTDKFKTHTQKFGAEFLDAEATSVDFSTQPYKISTNINSIETRAVIVATGMTNRKLGIPGEDRLMGRGVFVCATCDAALYEDRKAIVVGGGDSAIQEALDLAKFASEVTIIHRGERTTACRCLMDVAEKEPRIKFLYNVEVTEILGEKRVKQIRVRNTKTRIDQLIDTDGVLVAIGWNPNTGIFQGKLDMDAMGYLKTDWVKTSKPGIYVAGDLIDTVYHQVTTSCGSGCAAALESIHWLESQNS